MENYEFWSPSSTFQWCFHGGNYIGIFWGLQIDLARPDGEATFTRLPEASTHYYALIRLLKAKKYRVDIQIRRGPIFRGQQCSSRSKAGGCRAAQLLGGFGFRGNLLIVSWVATTPGYTRVQLISQEIDAASRLFCARWADLLKSYL